MKIVILTGAGVSAESGLGTFRDKGGVWTRYDLQEVATPEGFARDPAKVIDFYNMRRKNARGAKPNAAHYALARLQAEYTHEVALITQNVDGYHQQAGSSQVLVDAAPSGGRSSRAGAGSTMVGSGHGIARRRPPAAARHRDPAARPGDHVG